MGDSRVRDRILRGGYWHDSWATLDAGIDMNKDQRNEILMSLALLRRDVTSVYQSDASLCAWLYRLLTELAGIVEALDDEH